MKEEYRQLFHLFFGSFLVLFSLFVGKKTVLVVLFAALLVGMLLVHLKLRGHRQGFFDFFLEKLERKVDLPGKGAFMYVVGSLVLLSYSPDFSFALAVMMMLAAGDAASTIVGRKGVVRLPWNEKKTLEGLSSFALASLVVSIPFLSFSLVIVYSLLLAVIESLPLPFDDNLSIPIGALLLKFVLFA
ncbi:MAG: diacylglycerol/polyprenol kinase family protein [Candidatus Micrarchaeia archaeon]